MKDTYIWMIILGFIGNSVISIFLAYIGIYEYFNPRNAHLFNTFSRTLSALSIVSTLLLSIALIMVA